MNFGFTAGSQLDPDVRSGDSSRSRPLGAYCFDFDGLLADTARQWTRAFHAACDLNGGATREIDLAALRGASVPAAAALLSRQLDVEITPSQLLDALTAAFHEMPPAALPGVRAVLQALDGKTPTLVVTNGPRMLVEESLAELDLTHHFDAIVAADTVPLPKPAPDVYLAACQQAGVAPVDAVAFEDSPAGAQSARAAGLRVIGVKDGPPPLPADLLVARIDDPQVLRYLGLQ
jgi:HAD superfamily hydrolase (TIGR01509 family)